MENKESIILSHLRTAIYLLILTKDELTQEFGVQIQNGAVNISLMNVETASILLNEVLKNIEYKEKNKEIELNLSKKEIDFIIHCMEIAECEATTAWDIEYGEILKSLSDKIRDKINGE